jgi:REP element-mobilizing transposase RayT
MSRGCRGQPIFGEPADCAHFAHLLGEVVEEFGWTVYGWAFMPNHHHLLLGLAEPNLSAGMQRAHFLFAQRWNERHESTGHVFFRRFKNIPLLQPDAPQRVLKYIDLNPVRGGLCDRPEDWEWSSFAANIGQRQPLAFHSPEQGLRVMVPHVADPHVARPLYARAVYDRIQRTRTRGSPHDVRPTLDEILIPGDIGSIRDANETWWYSQRAIAAHIGCDHQTITSWLRGCRTARRTPAYDRWTGPAPQR